MAYYKVVVDAFLRVGVAGYFAVVGRVCKKLFAPGQHFMCVALVRYVKHKLIFGRVEHIVHCNRGFNKAQVRAEVAACGVYLYD